MRVRLNHSKQHATIVSCCSACVECRVTSAASAAPAMVTSWSACSATVQWCSSGQTATGASSVTKLASSYSVVLASQHPPAKRPAVSEKMSTSKRRMPTNLARRKISLMVNSTPPNLLVDTLRQRCQSQLEPFTGAAQSRTATESRHSRTFSKSTRNRSN